MQQAGRLQQFVNVNEDKNCPRTSWEPSGCHTLYASSEGILPPLLAGEGRGEGRLKELCAPIALPHTPHPVGLPADMAPSVGESSVQSVPQCEGNRVHSGPSSANHW